MRMTVLVVGGTGVFGSRLVERLALCMQCTVLIAARSIDSVQRLIESLDQRQPRATLRALQLDREQATAAQLRACGASIVVDAAGPFQGHEPRLARAAIAAGCHFIDLADARDYVAAFAQLDAHARAAGVLAVCGASSTPALSNAVLDDLCREAGAPWEVVIAITPGNRAPRGMAVIQAILSYAGQPLPLLEQGRLATRPGWSMLHRRTLQGLDRRWFSLCATPDLDLVPQRFASVRSVHFFAGLELTVLHCGLWLLSLLVRLRLLRSLLPYAVPLHWLAQRFERWGGDRGGMQVEVTLWSESGACVYAGWELIAGAGHGPYVPTLPALALIRRLLTGDEASCGAKPCVGLLTVSDILAESAGLEISTRRWITRVPSLFKRALGTQFDVMPAAVRALHSPRGTTLFRGLADIEGGTNLPARLLARVFRFPAAARQVEVQVSIEPREQSERWLRRFGARSFSSVLACGRDGRVTESFGPIRCTLQVTAHEHGLDIDIVAARLGVLPLPRWLSPWTRAGERLDAQGRFTFDVEIGLHGIGRLVRYRGWLASAAQQHGSGHAQAVPIN